MRRTQKLLVPSIWALSIIVAASGSAFAAAKITGKQIVDGSITGKDVKNGSLTAGDIDAKTRNAIINAAVAKSKNSAPSSANAGAAGKDGVNGTNGTNGTNGAKGDKGERGFNADGSLTVAVNGTETAGFTTSNTAGTGAITTAFENGGVRFTTGPSATWTGSARVGKDFDSVPLGQLKELKYKFGVSSTLTSVAPTVRITVSGASPCEAAEPDCSTAGFNGTANLVLEPIYATPVASLSGSTVDLLSLTKGWYSKQLIKGATQRDSATPAGYLQSLGDILANNPGLKITRIAVEAYDGSPWNNFDGSVDYLQVGFAGAPATRYDFG